jgi:hypothetical protein
VLVFRSHHDSIATLQCDRWPRMGGLNFVSLELARRVSNERTFISPADISQNSTTSQNARLPNTLQHSPAGFVALRLKRLVLKNSITLGAPPGRYPRSRMNHPTDTTTTGTKLRTRAELTPRERQLVEWVEKGRKRKLTDQEVHLALQQARHLGE